MRVCGKHPTSGGGANSGIGHLGKARERYLIFITDSSWSSLAHIVDFMSDGANFRASMAWTQSTSGRSAVSDSYHPFLTLAGAELGDAAGVPPRQVQCPTYCTTPDRAILALKARDQGTAMLQRQATALLLSKWKRPSGKTRTQMWPLAPCRDRSVVPA